ncbi:dihydroneopterin aldolase [Alishewanella sp. 16-MA]|uniref:7,8-dihydroneopterin aldolase n=1 Tax=Alishewanella maricola TaxID=2795740 RepID=A0ABS8C6U8_9ALTE|nr:MULTISPECIES: dihydroneopterin aldolase [Gammaproteobacteria]MDP5035205.1 dihydroneopterin aldolase [Alishewanella sp.]MCB5227660.1 dihydroneopterin aldolase [Alishewanella maricola]MCC5452680.1 dihydroneopterin aldolase [Rheinheimera sp. UJ51]MCF4010404.1 dihydroneopterin aldolase [Rheinheimera sp. UJ63]MDP5185617.1 dihydroneopterin aldolase [Alishewanella sp.]
MDIVFIKQLQVDTVIGVYDWEKTIKQRLLLDLRLTADQRAAAQADDIRLTLDYAVISARVIELITAEPIELIETVAERVAQLLLTEFSTSQVEVTVSKPGAVPQAQTVGVQITRFAPEVNH